VEYPFIELVNSQEWDWRGSGEVYDHLDEPEWVTDFVRKWHYDRAGEFDDRAHERLADLRSTLRELLEEIIEKGAPGKHHVDWMNRVMAGAPMTWSLDAAGTDYSLKLIPVHADWDWVCADIVASLGRLLADEELDRIKMCSNPDCRCVFFDESRNKSRRWCNNEICGNLMRVRRHRSRST